MFTKVISLAILAAYAFADSEQFILQNRRSASPFHLSGWGESDNKIVAGTALSFVITDDLKLKASDGRFVVVGEDSALTLGSEGSQVFTIYNDDGYTNLYYNDEIVNAYICQGDDTQIRLSGSGNDSQCAYYSVAVLNSNGQFPPSYPSGEDPTTTTNPPHYGNTTVTNTKTQSQTTHVTITSCEQDKCHETTSSAWISTSTKTIGGTVTEIITWCPIPSTTATTSKPPTVTPTVTPTKPSSSAPTVAPTTSHTTLSTKSEQPSVTVPTITATGGAGSNFNLGSLSVGVAGIAMALFM